MTEPIHYEVRGDLGARGEEALGIFSANRIVVLLKRNEYACQKVGYLLAHNQPWPHIWTKRTRLFVDFSREFDRQEGYSAPALSAAAYRLVAVSAASEMLGETLVDFLWGLQNERPVEHGLFGAAFSASYVLLSKIDPDVLKDYS